MTMTEYIEAGIEALPTWTLVTMTMACPDGIKNGSLRFMFAFFFQTMLVVVIDPSHYHHVCDIQGPPRRWTRVISLTIFIFVVHWLIAWQVQIFIRLHLNLMLYFWHDVNDLQNWREHFELCIFGSIPFAVLTGQTMHCALRIICFFDCLFVFPHITDQRQFRIPHITYVISLRIICCMRADESFEQ